MNEDARLASSVDKEREDAISSSGNSDDSLMYKQGKAEHVNFLSTAVIYIST